MAKEMAAILVYLTTEDDQNSFVNPLRVSVMYTEH